MKPSRPMGDTSLTTPPGVYLWQGGNVMWVDVSLGEVVNLADDLGTVLSAITMPDYMRWVLMHRFLRPAQKCCGPLTSVDCYTFHWQPSDPEMYARKYLVKVSMRDNAAAKVAALRSVLVAKAAKT